MNLMHSALQDAVENAHDCQATFREVASVVESFQGKPVWEGEVTVFDVDGIDGVTVAYAWADGISGSTKKRYFAVLGKPPINSPNEAVRAALVQRFREEASS